MATFSPGHAQCVYAEDRFNSDTTIIYRSICVFLYSSMSYYIFNFVLLANVIILNNLVLARGFWGCLKL